MAKESSWTTTIDRHWRWVIVLGVSASFMIMDGFMRGFGVFFSVFLLEFGGSASATTVVYSLRNAIYVVLSPLAAGLGDRFGERTLVMTGGVIISLAFALNFFASSLTYVIVFAGVVNGLGSVMITTCLPTVIGKHFQTRRSLATTLGYAGSGMGQLIIPHLIVYLVELYGVRGMLLIYGGIQLHYVAIGALFMPVEKLARIHRLQGKVSDKPSSEIMICVDEERQGTRTHGDIITIERYSGSITCEIESDIVDVEENEDNYPALTKNIDSFINNDARNQTDLPVTVEDEIPNEDYPIDKPDDGCCAKYKAFCDISLLLKPTLLLYFLATGIAASGFVVQVTFMVPRAAEMGVSLKQGATLLSISGGIDILGRITMGVLADVKSIGPIRVMIVYTMIMGIADVIYLSCDGFPSMIGYAVVFGIFGSAGHILHGPTIVELDGTERLASGVGWVLLHQGFCGTVVPPLMGLIRDRTGSYTGIFYTCAAFQLFASSLMVLVLYLHCRRHDIPLCNIKLPNRKCHEEHAIKQEMAS